MEFYAQFGNFFRNFKYIQELFVLVVKISKFLVNIGEKFGILCSFRICFWILSTFWNLSCILQFFGNFFAWNYLKIDGFLQDFGIFRTFWNVFYIFLTRNFPKINWIFRTFSRCTRNCWVANPPAPCFFLMILAIE